MTTPRLIPRAILFGNPERTSPQLSPDGRSLAWLAPDEGVLNVWVSQVGSDEAEAVTKDRDRGIRQYFFAHSGKQILYLQDQGGNENYRLYGVDLQTRETRDFTPFDDVQVRTVATSKESPDEILIAMNKEDARYHDVYRLDLVTGSLTLVAKNPGNFGQWIAAPGLEVRGAVAETPEAGTELYLRKDDGDGWEKLLSWDLEDSITSAPISFPKDGKTLWLLDSKGADTARLVKYDLGSGGKAVVAEDERYNFGQAMLHPDTHDVQGVSVVRERREWTVLNEAIRADFEALAQVAEGDFGVVSRDHADETWLVAFSRDADPRSFFTYCRQTRKADFIFHDQPELAEYELAPLEPIRFTSRDGLTIEGYITFPVGVERKALPMVLAVHGGPWGRDQWGFDPTSQWLANRGYVCLRVNFRGSTGYGKGFVNAGDREWSRSMHNDLVDGVRWAIDEGHADPKRVAIYGASYGGYAALVGATFTPDLFCCAVDMVGPSNLVTLLRSIPPYWATFRATLHRRVGDPDQEEEFLKSCSPLFKADQIRIPILIAQGANDPRVKQAESEQIVDAMKARGLDYEYLLFPDEGHGFAKPENRLKFHAQAEKFLAKHLGGRCEDEGP